MTSWQILGIEPTVDKKKIKKAYAIRLKSCNPEDDPQQFQALREAYEQALEASKFITAEEAQAHSPGEEHDKSSVIDKTKQGNDVQDKIHRLPLESNHPRQVSQITDAKKEAERLLNAICDIYNDFSRRIRVESWKQVLEQECLFNLEVKHDLRVSLIPFLIDNPHLPADVWKLLNNEFQWDEHFEELENKFGVNVIDELLHDIHSSAFSLSFNDISFPDQWASEKVEHYLWNRNYLKRLLIDIDCGQPTGNITSKDTDTFNDPLTNCTSDESRQLVEQLTKLAIKDPELLRLIAQHEIYAGNLQNALKYLEKLAAYYRFYVEANVGFANIMAKMGKYGEAQKHWFNVLRQERSNDSATNAIATKGLAYCYYKRGNLQGAKDMYEFSLRSTPYDIEARMRIVQINRSLLDDALRQIQDGNVSDETLIRAAKCYFDLGEFEKCVLFIADHEEQTNRLPELLFIYAKVLDEVNNYETAMERQIQYVEARKFYRLALKKNEEQGKNGYEIIYKMGIMEKANKNYDEAGYYLRKALKLDPLNDVILADLADVYRKLDLKDNHARTLETINKAISINDTRRSYYKIRAEIYYDNEMWQHALPDFEIALKNNPDNPGMLHDKGYCHLQLGQYEQAIKDFATAHNYSPSYLDPLVGLARAHHGAGHLDESRKCFCEHLEKAPEDEYGMYWRNKLFPEGIKEPNPIDRKHLERRYGKAGADIIEAVPDAKLAIHKDFIFHAHLRWNPNVTDDIFQLVAKLTDLEELNAVDTAISDNGLKHISVLPKLRLLQLCGTAISDAGIQHLVNLPLDLLDLSHTQISNSGLELLTGIKTLQELWIIGCPVNEKGIRNFQIQVPKCKVVTH